jgi:UDP-N-acetylmuramyl pentapeptide phosphotransferase/UDP-N-acetylglucosamine-1-phosphate transferase
MTGSGAIVRLVEVPVVGIVDLGVLAIPLTLFFLVGYANLFNFMDGIDGIAGGHAAVTAGFLGLWGLGAGDAVTGWSGLLLAAGALGFLRENRPPARIFMGDVGSLFLGLTIAALAVRASTQDPGVPFPVSFLLLGPFIYDAAFTLGRRIRAGENVLRAHRSHLYQRLVVAGRSHAEVTACYVGLTLVCGGLGCLYQAGPEGISLGTLLAGLAAMVVFTWLVSRVERGGGATP